MLHRGVLKDEVLRGEHSAALQSRHPEGVFFSLPRCCLDQLDSNLDPYDPYITVNTFRSTGFMETALAVST